MSIIIKMPVSNVNSMNQQLNNSAYSANKLVLVDSKKFLVRNNAYVYDRFKPIKI